MGASPVILYLLLYLPWGPEDHRTMLVRMPEYRYATPSECERDAPGDIAQWLDKAEGNGFGAITVHNIICFDTSGAEPA
jgi:hypothetical protein